MRISGVKNLALIGALFILASSGLPTSADIPPPPSPNVRNASQLIADAPLPPSLDAFKGMKNAPELRAYTNKERTKFKAEAEKMLAKLWKPVAGMKTSVVVSFFIGSEGYPYDVSLKKSSGSKKADATALKLLSSLKDKQELPPHTASIQVTSNFAPPAAKQKVATVMKFTDSAI